MVKLILMLAGIMVVLMVFAFSVYAVFFPLARTVAGGFQILSFVRWKRTGRAGREEMPSYGSLDPELGLTMADGGEKREGETDANGKK